MLPKNRRISKQDFKYLSSGKRFSAPYMVLSLVPFVKNTASISRFSFSASKKVAKTAILRNKLRRWGYAGLKTHLDRITPGYFLFFTFKKHEKVLTYKEVKEEIERLLSVSGMIR